MKLVTYRLADFEGSEMTAFGAVQGNDIVRLDIAPGHDHTGLGSMRDYFANLPHTEGRARAIVADKSMSRVPLANVRLLPAVQEPPLITVVTKMGDAVRAESVIKPAITGHGDVIRKRYPGGAQVGLRPMLAMVTGFDVAQPTEHMNPAGFVLLTEIVSHEIETGDRRVDVGIGPILVTPDEIDDPRALDVTVTFRDREPWHATTSGYELPPGEVLYKLLQRHSFAPGSIIGLGGLTGSFGVDGAELLEPGEMYTIAIDGVGELTQHLGTRHT